MNHTESFLHRYFSDFQAAVDHMEADWDGKSVSMAEAVEAVKDTLQELQDNNRKMMIIGNGGSAGVASHMAIDFWKNAGVRCLTFNDGALLTCLSNDYSYEEAFAYAVNQFGDEGDMLISISSSGNSQNIRQASQTALDKGMTVVTCSGFQPDNPLRAMGHVNFWVPSFSYGFVETIHQLIIHSLLDAKMYVNDRVDIFQKNTPM